MSSSYSIECSGPGSKQAIAKLQDYLDAHPMADGESVSVSFAKRDTVEVIAKIDAADELVGMVRSGRGVKSSKR